MTRFIVLAAVVALAIALPATHEAFAGNNNTKVSICHVNSSNSAGLRTPTDSPITGVRGPVGGRQTSPRT